MNILRLPLHAGGTPAKPPPSGKPSSSPARHRPTSCQGYVTKRGHYRKSWRVRYLRLNGDDLRVAWYGSKELALAPDAVPKGSFILASIEKHEYVVGGMGIGQEKPFGFKMVGHAPKKGYMELDVFVDTLGDLMKWLDVCHAALERAAKVDGHALADSLAKKAMFGFGIVATPQQQVKTLVATKEELLKQAIAEIEGAKLIGTEACNEIVAQGEKLNHIETNLEHAESELNYADKLLHHMKHPNLFMFAQDHHSRATPTKTTVPRHPGASAAPERGRTGDDMEDDVTRLAMLLGDLEEQAVVMNEEAIKSTAQIERIGGQLSSVKASLEEQTKSAMSATTNA